VEHFDIIVCFSTIKWVHLAFGDVGLKTLMLKIKESLNQGGIFMFDCQPWKSYKKAINERKSLKKESDFVPGEIHLKPHCFKEYLKALGFRLVLTID
jgi:7SK snRNA methylphosphate capping enzyme